MSTEDNSGWIGPEFDESGMTQWGWRVSHRENFKLGRNVEIGTFTMIDAREGVFIGDNVKIGFGSVIISYSSIDGKKGAVYLGDGCKIGANSVIMPGINVGQGAVVGANSFVNRDVPANEMWFGTPARRHKHIE